MFHYSFIALLFIVFNWIPCFAKPLSLDQAIRLALNESNSLKIQDKEILKFESFYKEKYSLALPRISGELKYTQYPQVPKTTMTFPALVPGTDPTQFEFSFKEKNEFDSRLVLTQPIYTFGLIGTAIEAAKKARSLSQITKESKKSDVIYATQMAYYSTLLFHDLMSIADKSLKNAQKNSNLLKSRFALSRPPRGDVIKLAADIAARVPMVKDASLQKDSALIQLAHLIGESQYHSLVLTSSLSNEFKTYPLEPSQNKLKTQQPSLKALEKNIELKTDLAKITKSEFYPRIRFFASYGQYGQSNSALNQDDIQGQTALGVSLTFNLWDSFEVHHKHQQSLIEKQIAEIELNQAKKALITQLEQTIKEYQHLQEIYISHSKTRKFAEESFQLTQNRFKNGQSSSTALNDSESFLTQTLSNEVLTLFKINTHAALIEKLISEQGY